MFTKIYGLPGEKWGRLPEYNNIYEFSNYGRVRSLDRYIVRNNGCRVRYWGKFINPKKYQNSNYVVYLNNGNTKRRVLWKIIKQIFPNQSYKKIVENIELTANIYTPTLLKRQLQYYNLEGVVWYDIKGYEGLYQICREGYIKSLTRKTNNKLSEPRILKASKTGNGYYKVTLVGQNGIPQTMVFHKLMHMMFLADYGVRGLTIDHVDGNKSNNSLTNLHVVTLKENIRRYRASLKR